jgi:hypothetical protein
MDKITKIAGILQGYRFSLTNEKKLQSEVEEVFKKENVNFKREHQLGDHGIVDFMVDNIAIELKVKGNPKSIYRQCRDYCDHDDVHSLILATNRSMGLPNEINNKPVFIIHLGMAHL